VKSIRMLPHHRVAVPVEVTGIDDSTGTWVVEPEELESFQVEESLFCLRNDKNPHIVVVNSIRLCHWAQQYSVVKLSLPLQKITLTRRVW